MPFKSKAQQAYMFINHPKLAKEFQAATPKNAKLPQRVKKEQANKRAQSGVMKGLM